MILREGAFKRFVISGVILGSLLILSACSSGHLQLFQTAEQGQFDAWVETIQATTNTREEAVAAVGAWEKINQPYEGGVYLFWPSLLSAFNQRTNCAGNAVVALEALNRLGYTDFVYVQVQGDWAERWHVIATDRLNWLSSGSVGSFETPKDCRAIADWINPVWTRYVVRTRGMEITEEAER